MAKIPGHQLAEVICGFWFDRIQNNWDSTYFGNFHEHIKTLGYSEKQEQKGFQIRLDFNLQTPENSRTTHDEMETRMVFKNPEKNSAVILAANYISIHKLPHYTNWENFYQNDVLEVLNQYFSLGLGNGLIQCNMVYLNQFLVDKAGSISELFGILPQLPVLSSGKQQNLIFQSQYKFEPNLLAQLKLIQNQVLEDKIGYVFECGCIATKNQQNSETLEQLIQSAHDKANDIFKSVLMEK